MQRGCKHKHCVPDSTMHGRFKCEARLKKCKGSKHHSVHTVSPSFQLILTVFTSFLSPAHAQHLSCLSCSLCSHCPGAIWLLMLFKGFLLSGCLSGFVVFAWAFLLPVQAVLYSSCCLLSDGKGAGTLLCRVHTGQCQSHAKC